MAWVIIKLKRKIFVFTFWGFVARVQLSSNLWSKINRKSHELSIKDCKRRRVIYEKNKWNKFKRIKIRQVY